MTLTTSRNLLDLDAIVSSVRDVLPKNGPFPLHQPSIGGLEEKYVTDCIKTGWVSYAGTYVEKFEEMLQQVTGAKYAVALSSGTTALQTALVACGLKKNEEVMVPSLTFIATANAIIHAGGIPHFIDSDPNTLGVTTSNLSLYLQKHTYQKNGECYNNQTGRKIKFIVPVNVFGHPVKIDELAEISNQFNIVIIQDSAEALGSLFKGKDLSFFGAASILSFNGNKIITTGGGGALITNDQKIADQARHLSTTAKLPHKWEFKHDQIGFNFRMPSLNAAMGCAQLERLDDFIENKRKLAFKYKMALKNIEGVTFFDEPENCHSNFWLNTILLDEKFAQDHVKRNELLDKFHSVGIRARPIWSLVHKMPMFRAYPKMEINVAENLEARIINLPSSSDLLVS